MWIIEGQEEGLRGDYRSYYVPYETIGTWTTRIVKLPSSGGYHAMVYPRLAEYLFDREHFVLLVRAADEAPLLHYRFLDRRTHLPLHAGWSEWLWKRGLRTGEVEALGGHGIHAYRCRPEPEALRADITRGIRTRELTVPLDDDAATNGHRKNGRLTLAGAAP